MYGTYNLQSNYSEYHYYISINIEILLSKYYNNELNIVVHKNRTHPSLRYCHQHHLRVWTILILLLLITCEK
jgi:hypothetical protein